MRNFFKNNWFKISFLIIIVIIVIIINGNLDKKKEVPQIVDEAQQQFKQEQQRKERAIKIYEQLILDNVEIVIEKIPTYTPSQSKTCIYRSGVLIEDYYNAEWYVVGNNIYVVNGLAKSLTPDIEYVPPEISYQDCY